MMEVLLLVALVALAVAHRRLVVRVSRLEQRVEALHDVAPQTRAPAGGGEARGAEPLFEERVQAARVVRSSTLAVDGAPGRSGSAPAAETQEVRAEPQPEPVLAAPLSETLGGLFERFVGGRLLIWAGGIALAVAGLFLVRYSIQIGLITPAVQMAMAAGFGLLLLALGEWAKGRPGALPDPRVAQALVGAAILVLYATAYGSFMVHHLIGRGAASTLLTMMTALALILSLRHGAPTAVMGLAGGFATPLLVGDANAGAVPLLAYLGLLDIALFAIAGRRGWSWLVASGVLLSFAWTAVLLFSKPADGTAVGLFILIVSIAASAVRAGGGWQTDFIRPAAIGIVQLALLVALSDTDVVAWGLFGALSAASFVLAARKAEYRVIPAVALAAALVLLAVKALVERDANVGAVGAPITLLFAAGGAWGVVRRRGEALLWTGVASAALLMPALILRLARPELLARPVWGLVFLMLAAGPALLGWRRARETERADPDAALYAGGKTALLLGALAAWDLVPAMLVPAAWTALAVLAAGAARSARDRGLSVLALLAVAAAAARAAMLVPGLWQVLAQAAVGMAAFSTQLPSIGEAALVLLLPAALLVAVWRMAPADHLKRARIALPALAAAFAAAALYVVFKRLSGIDNPAEFEARGFGERAIATQALFALGWLVCRGRLPLPSLDARQRWWAGMVLTGLAAARLVWFDMLLQNPLWVAQSVGSLPVLNLLVPAYLLSALWLYAARRGAGDAKRSGLWLVLSLASLVLGVMLLARQAWQGPILSGLTMSDAESYSYSAAGLLLSVALLLVGVRLPDKALRLAGLVLLTAMALKAFLFDAAALEGLLRILSFLGLGVALIFIGKLYTRVLNAEAGVGAGAK